MRPLFLRRVNLLIELENANSEMEAQLHRNLAEGLRDRVRGVPMNSILVRPEDRDVIERFCRDDAWEKMSAGDLSEVKNHLAHLPFTSTGDEVQAKRFDYLILGMQLVLSGTEASGNWERGQTRVMRLAENLSGKTNAASIARAAPALEQVTDPGWWEGVTVTDLQVVRRELRGLIQFVDRRQTSAVIMDLAVRWGS